MFIQETVKKIASGGSGIVRFSNKVGFIPFTLPNEVVEFSIIQEKKRFFFGKLNRVLFSSTFRKIPYCKYFGTCGGCSFQHVEYKEQLNLKSEIFHSHITKIGKANYFPKVAVTPADLPYYYRKKVSFQVFIKKNQLVVGYIHKEKSTEKVQIQTCLLLDPQLNYLTQNILFEFNQYPHSFWKELYKLEIIYYHQKQFYVQLSSNKLIPNKLLVPILEALSSKEKDSTIQFSILYQHPIANQHQTNQSWLLSNRKVTELNTSSNTQYKFNIFFGKQKYHIPGGDFVQIYPKQFNKILEFLFNKIQTLPERNLLFDIYCGAGLISFYLSDLVESVIGLDRSKHSIKFANNVAKDQNLKFEFQQVHLEHSIPIDTKTYFQQGIIILNPPRTGISKIVMNWILKQQSKHIFYISCEGSTFARDYEKLLKKYTLKEINVWDLFPQTSHFEILAHFELNHFDDMTKNL